MKYPLFQPRGFFRNREIGNQFSSGFQQDVLDSLESHETYIANDPLGVCTYHFFDAIKNIYFSNLPWEIYLLTPSGEMISRVLWRKAQVSVQAGLDQLRNDIENKEYLYKEFLRYSNELTSNSEYNHNNKGIYYTEEEFYMYFKSFFDFSLRYWESVEHGIVKLNTSNSDESLLEAKKVMDFLLLDLRGSGDVLDLRYLKGFLSPNESMPYGMSFEFHDETISFQNNGNISPERLKELQSIEQWQKEVEVEKQNQKKIGEIQF